jgi:hypothetical protein
LMRFSQEECRGGGRGREGEGEMGHSQGGESSLRFSQEKCRGGVRGREREREGHSQGGCP